jgi:hypothetical protein
MGWKKKTPGLSMTITSSDLAQITAPEHQEGIGEALNPGLNATSTICRNSTPEPIDVNSLPDNLKPTDVDSLPNNIASPPNLQNSIVSSSSIMKLTPPIQLCSGIVIAPPPGKSVHSLYLFALHESLGDPWDYSVSAGKFVLHSRACRLHLGTIPYQCRQINQCQSCSTLSENPNVIGIMNRIHDGVHPSTPFHYHGVGGLITVLHEKAGNVWALCLQWLNDAKKLVIKVHALDMHKQFIMAIGSTKVEHVEQLIKVSIAQNCVIWRCLELLDKVAQQVYRTWNYTEEDKLQTPWPSPLATWR